MLLDGLPERARDQLADHLEGLADERAEEIDWLADLIPGVAGVDRATVLRVLVARDRVIAQADAA